MDVVTVVELAVAEEVEGDAGGLFTFGIYIHVPDALDDDAHGGAVDRLERTPLATDRSDKGQEQYYPYVPHSLHLTRLLTSWVNIYLMLTPALVGPNHWSLPLYW